MRLALRAPLFFAVLLAVATSGVASRPATAQNSFRETDLVSDLPGRAAQLDSHLVNPWGLVPGPTGVFWSSDNGTSTSTLYQPDGTIVPLVVTIPDDGPTGIAVTSGADSGFVFPSADTLARALFIFVTESGTVDAWTNKLPPVTAVNVASTPDAVYKGLALAYTHAGPRLYAANFHSGAVDVFDRHFQHITLAGSFTDPGLPGGYGPFNIAVIDGRVFVTYAKQDADAHDDVKGAGFGYIDVFDTDGHFIRRFASAGALDAPWGIAVAPPGFGGFGGALLVGNFGDGAINAFGLPGGAVLGSLRDTTGAAIAIDGLWGLHFGSPASGAEVAGRLYFTAGLDGEDHGLFGYVFPQGGLVCENGAHGAGFWSQQCVASGGHGRGHGDGDDDGDDRGRGGKDHGRGRFSGRFGDGAAHGPGKGVISADSLTALLACAAASSPVFGPGGCFTADCDLLARGGRRTAQELAAQALLGLLLDRCAGATCDNARIDCRGSSAHTVGDVIALLEHALCGGGGDLGALARLADCASGSRDHDGDDDADDRGHGGHDAATIDPIVVTANGAPGRLASGAAAEFAIATATPGPVRFRIVDATGRLIAEPLHGAYVTGSVTVRWDGRDTRGALVPPGNYFYHASSSAGVATGKFVVLR